jgi:hypothetical protein
MAVSWVFTNLTEIKIISKPISLYVKFYLTSYCRPGIINLFYLLAGNKSLRSNTVNRPSCIPYITT